MDANQGKNIIFNVKIGNSWSPTDAGVCSRRFEFALGETADKYYKSMVGSDLYFYVGTFSQFPTWLIVGLYYPPKRLALPKKSQNRTLDELFEKT